MGVLIGVVVGYAFGTRAGEQGWDELKASARAIVTSGEFRDLVVVGLSIGVELLGRGSELLAGAVAGADTRSQLRPVA